jgi:PAS domain S-box-containing protein
MKTSSLLLHAILERTQDLVAAVDGSFRLLMCNQSYADECQRLYGRQPSPGDDLRLFPGHLPEHGMVSERVWSRALAGAQFKVTQTIGDPALCQEVYEFSYGQLSVDGATVAFHLGRKVTERVQREAEIQRRNANLEIDVEQRSVELKHANLLLKERRERLSAALSVSDAGTFRHDLRRQLGYWDERLQHYFDVELEDRPRPLDEFLTIVHPNDRAGVRAHMEESSQQLGPRSGVFRIIRSNGDVRWLQYRAQVFAGADGRPAEMIGACADVTTLKQAEYELKVRERQIRELADHMPVIVWSHRQNSSLEYINRGWTEYTGLDLRATRIGGWKQVIHPEDLPRVDSAMDKALVSGNLLDLECRFRRAADGSYRWFLVRCQPALNQQGEPVRWYGTAVDIEERVLAQRKWEQVQADLQHANDDLAHSLAQLEGIVGSMTDGMVLYGADGTRLSVNAAARLMYGMPLDADAARTRTENFTSFDLRDMDGNPLPPERWPSTRALNGEVVFGQEVILRRLDNGEQWIASYNGAPVYDEHGRQIYAVLTFRDVTERRTTEQALQAAVHARDRFLSIASHELRTPLTTLTMQLQMARRRVDPDTNTAPPPEDLVKILDTANRQTGRLAKLVDDLLDVSRSGLDQLEFHCQPMDLSQVVAETCSQFAIPLEQAGCELDCSLDSGVMGEWDDARLEQVIGNLLSNAIKYASGTQVQVRLRQDGQNAILTVRDHGPGIALIHSKQIFERFARFVPDNAVTGLGLGLYLTHQIVTGHGGTIELQPVKGPGACFVITLPLRCAEADSVPG